MKLEDFKERDSKKSEKKDKSNQLDFPEIYILEKEKLEEHGLTEKDLLYIDETEEKNLIYLNKDNIFVDSYIKGLPDKEVDLAKEQYQISAVILAMNLISQYKDNFKEDDNKKPTLKNYSKDLSRALAPIYMDFIRDISNIAED